MLKKTLFMLLLFAHFNFLPAAAMEGIPDDMHKKIMLGIDHLHMGRYSKSIEIFNKIKEIYPDHAAGYFFPAAALEWMMVDYRNYERADEYIVWIRKAIKVSKEMVKKDKNDPWAFFFLGASHGFKAIFHADTGSFWKAFISGYKGHGNMKKALKLKSDLWDAYYAFGMYHFWKGYYSRYISWLPLISNEKDRGIEEVKTAILKGTYVKVEAASSLIRIHFVEKDYTAAVELAQDILKDFPGYLYCYWYLADSYKELEQYDQSINALKWIQDYFEDSELEGPVAELELKYKLSLLYYEKEEFTRALEYLNDIAASDIIIDTKFVGLNRYPELAEKLIRKINKKIGRSTD